MNLRPAVAPQSLAASTSNALAIPGSTPATSVSNAGATVPIPRRNRWLAGPGPRFRHPNVSPKYCSSSLATQDPRLLRVLRYFQDWDQEQTFATLTLQPRKASDIRSRVQIITSVNTGAEAW